MEVKHTVEDRVSISLKEYNGLKNDIKLLIEDNNKLLKAFELDSKFVIITNESSWWQGFFSNFEKDSYIRRKVNTIDGFVEAIEEHLKEMFERLEKQKEDSEKILLKIEGLKKNSFWIKLKGIFN